MKLSLVTLALTSLAALPLVAEARPESYTLKKKPVVGMRTSVKEARSSKIEIRFKNRGAAVGTVEKTTLTQRYTQEVRVAQPELLIRDYSHSERTKQSKGTTPARERTSLDGRRVRLQDLDMKPDGKAFLISKRDRETLRFDRLAEALLPPTQVVRLRESWSIAGKALAGSIFGEGVARQGQGCNAKVTLTRVKEVKGRPVATLKAKVRIRIARTEQIPGIALDLKGEVRWDLEEGILLEASLAGPVQYTFKNTKTGERAEWTAKGSMRWSYQAELLASRAPRNSQARKSGAPPPPGTQALVCSVNPAHRVVLKRYPNCMTCGKPFDRDFKCGAKDHGWPWQFCPHDGAPLVSEAGAK